MHLTLVVAPYTDGVQYENCGVPIPSAPETNHHAEIIPRVSSLIGSCFGCETGLLSVKHVPSPLLGQSLRPPH